MIRVAMVGLGQWGPNLLRNLRENPAARVVALCDRDGERLRQFQPLHPEASLYRDIAMTRHRDIADAVVIATPAGLHEEHVRAALEAGQHVLVEKPLALSAEAAERLQALARERGLVLMAGHTFLFNPAVERLRDLIRGGALGRLQYILAQRLSLGHIREDVNALWNLAPHDVSILLWWLGTLPVAVSAQGIAFFEGQRQEDIALCTLEFPGPVIAAIQVSWLAPTKVREMTIVGSERMARYDDTSRDAPLTLYHRGAKQVQRTAPDGSLEGFRLAIRPGGEEVVPVEPAEPLAREIAHFLDCCATGRQPERGGADATDVVRVLEALDRSIKQGGARIAP